MLMSKGNFGAQHQPTNPEGGGLNVSRAIHKLGGDSTAFYTSGGITGNILQNLLDQEGINHRPIPIRGLTRETIINEKSTKHQYRFI